MSFLRACSDDRFVSISAIELAESLPRLDALWVKGGARVSSPECPLSHHIAADLLRRSETSQETAQLQESSYI